MRINPSRTYIAEKLYIKYSVRIHNLGASVVRMVIFVILGERIAFISDRIIKARHLWMILKLDTGYYTLAHSK